MKKNIYSATAMLVCLLLGYTGARFVSENTKSYNFASIMSMTPQFQFENENVRKHIIENGDIESYTTMMDSLHQKDSIYLLNGLCYALIMKEKYHYAKAGKDATEIFNFIKKIGNENTSQNSK